MLSQESWFLITVVIMICCVVFFKVNIVEKSSYVFILIICVVNSLSSLLTVTQVLRYYVWVCSGVQRVSLESRTPSNSCARTHGEVVVCVCVPLTLTSSRTTTMHTELTSHTSRSVRRRESETNVGIVLHQCSLNSVTKHVVKNNGGIDIKFSVVAWKPKYSETRL